VNQRTIAGLVLGLVALLSHAAVAGLLDSPPPTFDGVAGRVVYRMGPAYFERGRTDTIVTCTNVGAGQATLAVEIFDADDRLVASADRAGVAPGAAVSFGTSPDASRPDLVVADPRGPVRHGKARISATAVTLACVAIQATRQEDGTLREMPLELVKKVAF
jgi:hypothetical protein